MIYEIRNYYFEPSQVDAYKQWAKHKAMGYLKRKFNVLGFWADTGLAPEITGQAMDQLGPSNITWIIGWDNVSRRKATIDAAFATPEWQAIFKDVPGGMASYLRIECKFMESLM
jgi:NIPSNAP